MPTAKQLYQLTENAAAYGSGIFPRVDSALKEYRKARCYHPQRVKVFDSHLGKFVVRNVPCGHCYHCMETKQNEWVTRLYAHCEDFKYVYFTTLTYRSFDPYVRTPYIDYLLEYLAGAEWQLDSKNYNSRYCYSPSILCKSHYQNFIKRLRKNTGIKNITYLMCGEYGSDYGRPHFHFILFSNSPISSNDIKRAWGLSVSLKDDIVVPSRNGKNPRFLPFGRIEHDDLVENGTFTPKNEIKVDGQYMSPRKCFAYVAKYCVKREYNDSRVKLIYDYLQNSVEDYERKTFETLETNYFDFKKSHSPFISVSRGIPIGSLYLERHIQDVVNRNNVRPPLQTEGVFILPSYFRRRASESLYSLRSQSKNNSLRKGNLPALASSLSLYIQSEISNDCRNIIDLSTTKTKYLPFHDSNEIKLKESELLNSQDCFIDVSHGQRRKFLLVTVVSHGGTLVDTQVNEYKYIRGRGWSHCNTHSVHNWCLHYLTSMPADFARYLSDLKAAEDSEYYYNLVLDFYAEFDRLDKFYNVVNEIENENQAYFDLKSKQKEQYKHNKLL